MVGNERFEPKFFPKRSDFLNLKEPTIVEGMTTCKGERSQEGGKSLVSGRDKIGGDKVNKGI
jgi:hypothetical protein